MLHIILLGTLDTKLDEFIYLYDQIISTSARASQIVDITLIDCGRSPVWHDKISISQSDLVSRHGSGDRASDLTSLPRGEVIKYMTQCTTASVTELVSKGDVDGIISAGGSGGTTLAAAVMREAAPIGMPKLIVSTVASGDTGPLIGETDMCLMYSVVDIAGTNELLRNILSNAAGAIVGMAGSYQQHRRDQRKQEARPKTRIGITMFGVTTPCVTKIQRHLESKYPVEVFVFHATGHGGQAMERLIQEGRLDAVLDITTTEICDYLFGGNMSAGPTRLEAALKAGIPNIISLGATDMVNFGPKTTVPPQYSSRKLFEHNPMVTLMRTTPEECKEVGEFMIDKVKTRCLDPSKVQFWIPRGVSMISTPGGAFYDQAADDQLAETIERNLEGSGIKVVHDDRDINDSGFAVDIAEQLMRMIESR